MLSLVYFFELAFLFSLLLFYIILFFNVGTIIGCTFCLSEILRNSGMLPNQGFGDLDRLRHRSPSPMASSNLMSNVAGTGIAGWNALPQEVFCVVLSGISNPVGLYSFFI